MAKCVLRRARRLGTTCPFYGQITPLVPNDPFPGYMPPPLDGIWATGPYLHNGSVPTLELLS